jgi:hypothetical protein
MKIKPLSVFLLALVTILNACSPFTITSSSGEQPTPIVESIPATGYQPVDVDQVEVEVGVGSPIPVHVNVSGNLPDSCAQVEFTEIRQEGTNFMITLSTVPSDADGCIQDSLPFRILIPLNVVNLPAGSYSVDVNGSSAIFELDTANTASSLPMADSVLSQDDVQVDDVNVEIGVGSPIPVHAVVSLNLPNTCAQLGEIRLHREGTTFYVRLIAYIAERADCQADSIPFRAEIPLNIVNLPEGPYEVNVNGVTASFDPRTEPSSNSGELACTEPVDVPAVDGRIEYNGISFDLDPALAYTLSARSCPAVPLQENQGPGEAHPGYVAFTFPTFNRENIEIQPELRVYEVSGDMSAYTYPLNSLDELQTVINQHPEPVVWFNTSPLHTRQAYLSFDNGAGVRGLVQYMQDFFFYTNNGLLYEYNGLTQDGRYFLNFRHPLSVPFLMELDGISLPPNNLNSQAIPIPEWPSDFEQQRKVIESYNTEALSRFEAMSDSDALPDIALVDALVESVQVSKP